MTHSRSNSAVRNVQVAVTDGRGTLLRRSGGRPCRPPWLAAHRCHHHREMRNRTDRHQSASRSVLPPPASRYRQHRHRSCPSLWSMLILQAGRFQFRRIGRCCISRQQRPLAVLQRCMGCSLHLLYPRLSKCACAAHDECHHSERVERRNGRHHTCPCMTWRRLHTCCAMAICDQSPGSMARSLVTPGHRARAAHLCQRSHRLTTIQRSAPKTTTADVNKGWWLVHTLR